MLYVIALICVALVYLRPADLFPVLSGVPVVLMASACAAPALALAFINDPRRLLTLPNDRYLFGLWFAIPVSCLVNGWLAGALSGFAQFGQIVFLYILVRYAIDDERRFSGLVVLFVGLVLVQAVSGIVQFYSGVGLGGIAPMVEHGILRIRGAGIFNDPNDLALTLVTAIPLLIAMARTATPAPGRRLLFGLVLLTMLGALYFTNSRGGILALAASAIVYAYRRLGKWVATFSVVAVVTAIVVLGPTRINEIQTDEESAQGRIAAWSEGLQMLRSQPLFGVGWNRFTDFNELVAHNAFVQIIAETGLAGGFFFVGVAYTYFLSLRAVRRTGGDRSDDTDFTDALVASGIGLLTGAAFLSRQDSPAFYMVVSLGAAYAGLRGAGSVLAARPAGAGLFDAARVVAIEGLAVAAVYLAVITFAIWRR